MKNVFIVLFASVVFSFPIMAVAADGAGAAANPGSDKEMLTQELITIKNKCVDGKTCTSEDFDKYMQKKETLNDLKEKFKFGVAIGFERYRTPYVSKTSLVGSNKDVHISSSQFYKPTLWLETHYIWDGKAKEWGFTHSAPGFFVGIRVLSPDTESFEAATLGLMWSFKRTAIGDVPPANQYAESINIGFGRVWHKTRQLASGITEGQPLPAGYTDVEFDERDELSWMLMVSSGF